MIKVIICGTIGLDDIKTPFGEIKNALGGSATYASIAASCFVEVGMVSIAGKDLPSEHVEMLKNRKIDCDGVEFSGKNFRWSGEYHFDMNEAKTIKTELNSLLELKANLPENYKKKEFIFLANVDPELQIRVLDQITKPKLVVMDTMNFWIESKRERLLEAIKRVDVLMINDGEARELFNTVNLFDAAKKALTLGPKQVIIKKGEHGALLFSKNTVFNAPGYPLEVIKDPTGCGDCFAGGFIGYLAATDDISESNMRKAVVYGSAIASFNAEDFSVNKVKKISREDIEKRYNEFKELRKF